MCYICERCGYKTNKKSHFYRHLIRKRVCKSINYIPIEEIREKYGIKSSKYSCPAKKDFKCDVCNKYYSTKFNLEKHIHNVHILNETYTFLHKSMMKNNKKYYKSIIIENSELYNTMKKEINKIYTNPYIVLYKKAINSSNEMYKETIKENNKLYKDIYSRINRDG